MFNSGTSFRSDSHPFRHKPVAIAKKRLRVSMPPKALLVQRRRALDKWDAGLNSLADHVSEYEATSNALHPFCDPSESAVISQASNGAPSTDSDENGATVEDAFAHLNKRIEDMEALEVRISPPSNWTRY